MIASICEVLFFEVSAYYFGTTAKYAFRYTVTVR